MQDDATYAVKDGAQPGRISALGTKGKWAKNMERDFVSRALKAMGVTIHPYEFPCTARVDGSLDCIDSAVMLPHELFAHIYSYDRRKFHEMFFAGSLEFWNILRETQEPWYEAHPLRSFIEASPHMFACGRIFADNVTVNKLNTISINVILFHSVTNRSRL